MKVISTADVKFLKISNRGALDRRHVELIGLSSKRGRINDPTVIGSKGSGIKLATIAALRLGLHPVISSTDSQGCYALLFTTQPIEVGGVQARQIIFNYYALDKATGESRLTQTKPKDIVLESFEDWDRPIGDDDSKAFKVLREFICNAIDEDKDFDLAFFDKPTFAKDGQAAVNLLYTPELRAIFEESKRYFKFRSEEKPLYVADGIGEIYPKSDPARTRLFILGVLADCAKSVIYRSLFDYSLCRKDLLSEERILKNRIDYEKELGRLFGRLTDVRLAVEILTGISRYTADVERIALHFAEDISPESRRTWLAACRECFGENCVASSGDEVVDMEARQIYGRAVVRGHTLAKFLCRLGIKSAADLFPKEFVEGRQYELLRFSGLSAASRARFMSAFRPFVEQFPDAAEIPIVFFLPIDERIRSWLGRAGHGDRTFREIWIAAKSRTELGLEFEILGTLAHEHRHIKTKAFDHDRALVAAADEDMAMMLLRRDGYCWLETDRPMPPLGSRHLKPKILEPEEVRALYKQSK